MTNSVLHLVYAEMQHNEKKQDVTFGNTNCTCTQEICGYGGVKKDKCFICIHTRQFQSAYKH